MNTPRQMLVVYLKLQKELRFSQFCGENYYWSQAMKVMLNLTPDDENALKLSIDRVEDKKALEAIISRFEAQSSQESVPLSDVIGSFRQ